MPADASSTTKKRQQVTEGHGLSLRSPKERTPGTYAGGHMGTADAAKWFLQFRVI